MSTQINDKICPFCKAQNECMAHSEKPCWCKEVNVPLELTGLVPIHLKRKSCICPSCIELFKENPKALKLKFISQLSGQRIP
jgi:hypothetical protein